MPIALARIRIAVLLAVAAAVVLPAGAAGADWRVPVDGAVVRGFDLGRDPFEAGRHRGADFAAAPGAVVRAACGGRVAVAGRVGTSGRVVTVLCGRWRVTHMPLAAVAVRAGDVAGRGDVLGTLAPSTDHAGLHLGVRRNGTRFGYTDPLRFLDRSRTPPLIAPGRGPEIRTPRTPPLIAPGRGPEIRTPRTPPPIAPGRGPEIRTPPRAPLRSPRTIPRPRSVPIFSLPAVHRRPAPGLSSMPAVEPRPVGGADRAGAATARSPGSGPIPWPAWAGLGLMLAGVGVRWRRGPRRRRPIAVAARPRASPEPARR